MWSGGWFDIKMPSYQYRKFHCGDKTVVISSYLHNGISYTGKILFILNQGPAMPRQWINGGLCPERYNDVIMGMIASQITSLTIVYSIVYSGADKRKHQSSASLAIVRGFHRDQWIPHTNGQLREKCFDDIIMQEQWNCAIVAWRGNVQILTR